MDPLDDLGPVDWLVVEFPSENFGDGTLAPILADYVDRGLIRILDMMFLQKDADGGLEFAELEDVGDGPLQALRGAETELAMVLSEQDVLDLAVTIEPGHSGALLVWENVWAAPFGAAVRHAGGELVASGRIPVQALLAALEADAEEGD
ncbi:DUF6325 family protein [Nocardioides sp. Soil805]|uniref:DUF6325 family protein n=1 Tax=Nocardioides sp. Soil805 TaxID=1736416 RepID=UPI0007032667|nr:DUF6325 family protein [Nocardioides sp. Soil805]KRF34140.1 hypothetical protein ASG94_15520 [Nocardioides sp. Soil805]